MKCLKGKSNKLQTIVPNQAVILLDRVISKFKVSYQRRNNLAKDETAICLQIATVLLICGRIPVAIYQMFIGLMTLGRLKYVQLSYWCLS